MTNQPHMISRVDELAVQYWLATAVTWSVLGLASILIWPDASARYWYTGQYRQALLGYAVISLGAIGLYESLYGFELLDALRGVTR